MASIVMGFSLKLLVFARSLGADSFTLTPLPLIAHGLDNTGQIVGYGVAGETTYGLLYSQGRTSTLFVPGSSNTLLFGINNIGQITGYYDAHTGGTHSFVYANGQFTSFDTPGNVAATYAQGINDSGQVVGYRERYLRSGELQAFSTTAAPTEQSRYKVPARPTQKAWTMRAT